MYSHIHAANEDRDSRGKTTKVTSDVEKLDFSIDRENQLLVIRASCDQHFGTGERGGDVSTISRNFLLPLKKEEVEKLVATALNKRLLKNLDIANLQEIDSVGKLELDIQRKTTELDRANREVKRLRKIIDGAKDVLSKSEN